MAVVKIKLQTKKVKRFWFDSWEDATDWVEDTLRPKRNRARGFRVTARKACNGDKRTSWRSVVDVDIVGYWDSPDKLTTAEVKIGCGR